MHIIDTLQAMARALARLHNPWLKRRLVQYRARLHEADCDLGDLGPVIIVETGDTLLTVQAAAGMPITTDWEYHEVDHGWHELAYVTCDDGSGAVLLIPAHEGIDPALLALIGVAVTASSPCSVPPARRKTITHSSRP